MIGKVEVETRKVWTHVCCFPKPELSLSYLCNVFTLSARNIIVNRLNG
jgi:hypothetical protein